jgi:hypothetical protein
VYNKTPEACVIDVIKYGVFLEPISVLCDNIVRRGSLIVEFGKIDESMSELQKLIIWGVI